MTKKPKLKLSDRLEIKILLDKGYSLRAFARSLGRSPNTISYEVEVNGGVVGYNPQNAQMYARTRKKDSKLQWKKIEEDPTLKAFIVEKLTQHWNPDEIAGYMKRKKMKKYVSKNTIYRWLYSGRGQQYCDLLYSQRYTQKKRVKKTERVMIPARVPLEERPRGATNRTRYGHWEDDTVVSRKGCGGGLSTGSERKSRLVWKMQTKCSDISFPKVLISEKFLKRKLTRLSPSSTTNRERFWDTKQLSRLREHVVSLRVLESECPN